MITVNAALEHIRQISTSFRADFDCSSLAFPAKFAVAGDFDGDRKDELAICIDAPDSGGNDFWVMKFDTVKRVWRHIRQITRHPLGADLDCSSLAFPAKFAVAASLQWR